MTNAELIAKIKAEIERRIGAIAKAPSDNGVMDSINGARGHELMKLLSFLSTLESEKPIDGLEEEVKRYYSDNFAYISSDQPTLSILTNIARHFAEWGYLRAAEKYNEIEYNRQRAEECVPADLEEAAESFAFKSLDEVILYGCTLSGRRACFIAGAKWQAEKDTRDMYMSDNRHFERVYQLGRTDMREQMLKEAVEYEVGMHGEPIKITLDKYVQRAKGISPGDKVRIIIVKEDEK